MQGIQIALQSLDLSDGLMIRSDLANEFVTRPEAAKALNVLNEHDKILKQCLKFVTNAYGNFEAKSDIGIDILNPQTLDDAKQFAGNVGNVPAWAPRIRVEGSVASGRSKQAFGNLDGDAFAAFMK